MRVVGLVPFTHPRMKVNRSATAPGSSASWQVSERVISAEVDNSVPKRESRITTSNYASARGRRECWIE